MWLIAGLGNPGADYAGTRHNIGFRVVDLFAARRRVTWKGWKGIGEVGRTSLGGEGILLVKPQDFMNRSGPVLARLLRGEDLPVEAMIVVHDEMDLPFETLRLKRGGGAGGHKGVASILEAVGSDGFIRVRMGVGRPEPGERAEDYVLGPFPAGELERLPAFLEKGADALECILRRGLARAMNLYNVREKRGGGDGGESGG